MFSHRWHHEPTPNAFSLLIGKKRAAGANLLDLTVSNPTTAGFIYDHAAIQNALLQPGNWTYAPDPRGLPSARRAVAGVYRERGCLVPSEAIFLTPGTSDAYAALFKLLGDPGDEVLIPEPGYPLLAHLAAFEGLKAVTYPLRYDSATGWTIDLEILRALITEATCAVVVVNPNNPTGQFLKIRELSELDDICCEKDLALIVDEVFSDFVTPVNADARVHSAVNRCQALTFVLNGVSKMLGLPQMKLAWMVVSGDARLAVAAAERLEFLLDFYLSAGTPVQLAAGTLLTLRPGIQEQIRRRIDANHQCLLKLTAATRNSVAMLREGGWYGVVEIHDAVGDEDRVLTLAREDNVLVHPGYYYDFAREGFVVVSLLTPADIFETGIRRLTDRYGKI
ncbi:MAG: pyridoxal phosphate-dependent aminotransferase [Pseudomonadota bacterium]